MRLRQLLVLVAVAAVAVAVLVARSDGLECVEEGGEGSAAVAEGEFGLDVEFGHGLVLFGEIEEWIVAEAVGAAWGR